MKGVPAVLEQVLCPFAPFIGAQNHNLSHLLFSLPRPSYQFNFTTTEVNKNSLDSHWNLARP